MQVCEWLEMATSHSRTKKYVYLLPEFLLNDPFSFLCGFLPSFSISFLSSHILISPVSLSLVDLAQARETTL